MLYFSIHGNKFYIFDLGFNTTNLLRHFIAADAGISNIYNTTIERIFGLSGLLKSGDYIGAFLQRSYIHSRRRQHMAQYIYRGLIVAKNKQSLTGERRRRGSSGFFSFSFSQPGSKVKYASRTPFTLTIGRAFYPGIAMHHIRNLLAY